MTVQTRRLDSALSVVNKRANPVQGINGRKIKMVSSISSGAEVRDGGGGPNWLTDM